MDTPYSVPTGVVPSFQIPPLGSVGDVTSTAVGSGARYNAGKPALELLPIGILAEVLSLNHGPSDCLDALGCLGEWQSSGKSRYLHAALHFLGPNIWNEAALVFDYGRKKYAEWNWAKGMAWSIPTGCAVRHLTAPIWDSEEYDKESTLPHRAHAACNIIMLLTYATTFPEGDDRPRYLESRNAPTDF